MNQNAWILSSVVNIQLKIHHRSKEPPDRINLHHISCRSSFWPIAPRARFRPERRLLDSSREAIMNCMELHGGGGGGAQIRNRWHLRFRQRRRVGNKGRTLAAGGTAVGVNGAGNTWVDKGAAGSRWLPGGDDAGNQL
jgi:hypothetical protein